MVSFGRQSSSPSLVHSLAVVLALVPAGVAACSSSTSGGGTFTGDDGGSSGSSTSGSSSGGDTSDAAPSSGSKDAGLGPRVPSEVVYNADGIPECGTTPCDLSSGKECCLESATTAECIAQTASCKQANGMAAAAFKCAEAGDCPSGQVCCAVADVGTLSAGSECQTVKPGGSCTPADTSMTGSVQLCQRDAECVNGETCSWQVCNVAMNGLVKPQLTMCGSPQGNPWNCSPH